MESRLRVQCNKQGLWQQLEKNVAKMNHVQNVENVGMKLLKVM